MPATTYQDFLKMANAQLRLNPAVVQLQEAAKINEIQAILTLQGQTASAWDYPGAVTAINGTTANGRSTVVDYARDFYHKHALVRIVTTIGASPTATYAIQGSTDNSTWSNVNYADYLSTASVSNSNLTITTAGTVIKLVLAGQSFRYLSVLVSADTNVTNTIDITMIG